MPMYSYRCSCGAVAEQYSRVSERDSNIPECHGPMQRQLCAPMVAVQADIHALSPIDGTPLTSRRARTEYMKRHDLQEALPSAEVIRNANERKRKNQELAAKNPKLPEPIKQQLYKEGGFPA